MSYRKRLACLCGLLIPMALYAQIPQQVVAGTTMALYRVQDEQIEAATLFYRLTGDRHFMQQPLLHQKGEWSISLQGNQLRPPGLEYYVQFRMKDGSLRTDPARYPQYNPLHLTVAPRGALEIRIDEKALNADTRQIKFTVSGQVDEQARVYIDDVDVTDFVSRNKDQWVLDSEVVEPGGTPILEITTANGQKLASVPLDFASAAVKQPKERELVLRGNASFSLGGQRDSSASDNGALALSGNLHAETEYRDGDFSSHFSGINVNYQHGADPAFNLSSGFLLNNRYRNHSLQFGDVSVSGTPLVLSGFSRRGLVAKTENDNWSGSVFNVRTAPAEGWESGVSFDDRQTYGLSYEQQLGAENKTQFNLAVVSGKQQSTQSSNVGTSDTQPKAGDSAGIELSTELGGVSIAAQVAASDFDADTADATPAKRDNAYELKLSRNIYGLASSLGFHRYGANYATIANPNFSNDRQGYDLTLGSQIQFLGWSASFSSTRDNVEQDPLRPVVTSSNTGLNLNFVIENWPALNIGFNLSNQTSRDEPDLTQRVDNTGQDISLGLSDNFGPFNLAWSSSLGRLQDQLDSSNDSDTRNHSLSVGYSGSAASLNLNLSRNESEAQVTQVSDLVNLSADFPLFSDSIVLNSQFSWQHNTASDHSADNKIIGGSARISWTMQDMFSSVTSKWANARFSLSWTYNRNSDAFDATADSSDQRVLLEFSLGAPVSFEQNWQF